MKTLIIIPAYNEEKNIGQVIKQTREYLPFADLLVINDGSSDETLSVARRHGARVIDLPFNLGIGGAMQTGYKYALENQYEAAIQIDGDGQHLAGEASKILGPLEQEQADLVVGSRFIGQNGYKTSLMRLFGKHLFSASLGMFTGQIITDPTSGFRAVSKILITFFAEHYPQDYPEVESILLAKRSGFRVTEVPVVFAPRGFGSSSITAFRAVYYMIKVVLAMFVIMLRRREADGKNPDF